MNKKIEDYLHFYIGQNITVCEYEGAPFTAKLTGVVTERTDHELMMRVQCFIEDEQEENNGSIAWYDADEMVELHLRPLSSMTEEQAKEYAIIKGYSSEAVNTNFKFIQEGFEFGEGTVTFLCLHPPYGNKHTPEQFIFLLRMGLDLFGLIDAKLAIDATTLNESV
jgi:hypothetical protein